MISEHNDPCGGDVASVRRVATYSYTARVEPRSIAAQQDSIRAYIAEHPDWLTVAAYTDSGHGSDRPGLNGAINAARRGEFDMLVVHQLDRLSRRLADLATILIALDSASIGLVDVAESFDRANPAGWTTLPTAANPRTTGTDGRRLATNDRRPAITERSRCRPRHHA